MRGHLETSLGGIHLGLITFLFIVFLLWRQFHILTLRNKNKSIAPHPNTLQTAHNPARSPARMNPRQHTLRSTRAPTYTRFLSFFRLISVNSEFPSPSETPTRLVPIAREVLRFPCLPFQAGYPFPPADGDRRSRTTNPQPELLASPTPTLGMG